MNTNVGGICYVLCHHTLAMVLSCAAGDALVLAGQMGGQ